MTEDRQRRPRWEDTANEAEYLFNPAFMALLQRSMVSSYVSSSGDGMPMILCFLLPPLVLHQETREALPRGHKTTMLTWLQGHREQLVTIADRVINSRSATRSGLIFGISHRCVTLKESLLEVGQVSIDEKAILDLQPTADMMDCLVRAAFLGKWLHKSGRPETIFASWGITP